LKPEQILRRLDREEQGNPSVTSFDAAMTKS